MGNYKSVRVALRGKRTWLAVTLIAWCLSGRPAHGQTVLSRVSVDAAGAQVAGASGGQPAVSADGRYVAFTSTATNLVSGDANNSRDIFVKDRQTGAVTRISIRTDLSEAAGDSVAPDISTDGRFVTFVSAAALVADDTNQCPGAVPSGPTCPDVYVHDRTTGATTRVSLTADGLQANGASAGAHITTDGRFVVFASSATNLVANDTNQVGDVFLRDRQASTTTRVSVSTAGVQSTRASGSPTISDEGSIVAFTSDSTTIDPSADTLACTPGFFDCTRIFFYTLATGATTRAPLTDPRSSTVLSPPTPAFFVRDPALSQDGQTMAFKLRAATAPGANAESTLIGVYSLLSGRTKMVWNQTESDLASEGSRAIGISANGRVVASCSVANLNTYVVSVADTATALSTRVGERSGAAYWEPAMADCDGAALSGDGMTAFFGTSADYVVAGDTNGGQDIFAFDRDPDRDGLPSEWETRFGLNGNDPSDANADPDGDGLTNRQELDAGTHPRGFYKQFLAEGADNAFFTTSIHVFNPGAETTDVVLRFLGQNGVATTSHVVDVRERSTGLGLWTFASRSYPGVLPDDSFSTVIESDKPVAVERSVTWGGGPGVGYGSHAETAVASPSRTWYFAEGATHGRFDLFYLLQNPNNTPANVAIAYLRPAPLPPITLTYELLPNSRRTIWVDQEPALGATDVSARIDSDVPILAERSMYLSSETEPFAGGTSSAGLTAPATRWFVAEGATGGFFDLYLLIGNPSTEDASVTVRYLLPDGNGFDKVYPVAARSRLTIGVDGEDPRLAGTAVSAVLTSTNDVPIVVERAMWWASPTWYEGSVTAATTDTSHRWALAGGYVAPQQGAETYLLVANPNDAVVNVTFDVGLNGSPAVPRCRGSAAIPARGRYTVGLMNLLCPETVAGLTLGWRVAGVIESQGGPIVVERATYWSTPTQVWAAGESTLLTKIP